MVSSSSLADLIPSLPTSLLPSTAGGRTVTRTDRAALEPKDGAPLVGDESLIPSKYRSHPSIPKPSVNHALNSTRTTAGDSTSRPRSLLSGQKSASDLGQTDTAGNLTQGRTTALNPRPPGPIPLPSQLLDAPSRAAMGFPNSLTAQGQARAVRGGEAKTPEYEVNGLGLGGPSVTSGGSGVRGGGGDAAEDWPDFAPSPPLVSVPGPRVHALPPNGNHHLAPSQMTNERAPLLSPTPRYADASSSSTSPSWLPSNLPPSPRPDLHDLHAPLPIPLSRSSSAASTRSVLRRIFIDRPSTPSNSRGDHLSRPTFPPPSLTTYQPIPHRPMSLTAKVNLFINQLISVVLSTFFLAGVVLWALGVEIRRRLPNWIWPERPRKFPWDDDRYWRREGKKVSKEPRDYARQVGMEIENQEVETDDGYLLRVHKVVDPKAKLPSRGDGKGGFPVLVLHGLFQSSGSFVTSEERSLAFWLAREGGYQVYLGNTRGVFDMGHRTWGRNDPRFWDWTIRELAMYDLPALVEHVCRETGYEKIAFIGHSQGNGLTFISLSLGMCPNLGRKLSVFIALAPAVYAGPLTTGFPFTTLNQLEWGTWKRFFGVLDFIPLMRWSYDYAPPKLFAILGYTMFAFLFGWTDTNWLLRRKTKMFRFTPTPVSSASIFWWCGKGGFADRKCTLDDTLDRWYDDRFPPLSIYYGGRDYLVLTEPLLDRLEKKDTDVKVIKVTKLDKSEHCDFYWAAEAVEWAYESFRDDIEQTRPKHPDEMDGETPMIRVDE